MQKVRLEQSPHLPRLDVSGRPLGLGGVPSNKLHLRVASDLIPETKCVPLPAQLPSVTFSCWELMDIQLTHFLPVLVLLVVCLSCFSAHLSAQ